MNNQEIIEKFKSFAKQYEELLQEKEIIEQQLQEQQQINNDLIECVYESNEAITDSIKSLDKAQATITNIVNNYLEYQSVIKECFDSLLNTVNQLANKDEIYTEELSSLQQSIDEIQQEIIRKEEILNNNLLQ